MVFHDSVAERQTASSLCDHSDHVHLDHHWPVLILDGHASTLIGNCVPYGLAFHTQNRVDDLRWHLQLQLLTLVLIVDWLSAWDAWCDE